MRPSESRLLISFAWLAGIGILALLVAQARLGSGVAVTLGAVYTIALLVITVSAVVCPRCNRSLYGVNRTRCRVCGFDLRGV